MPGEDRFTKEWWTLWLAVTDEIEWRASQMHFACRDAVMTLKQLLGDNPKIVPDKDFFYHASQLKDTMDEMRAELEWLSSLKKSLQCIEEEEEKEEEEA